MIELDSGPYVRLWTEVIVQAVDYASGHLPWGTARQQRLSRDAAREWLFADCGRAAR